jgi:hypothetical protein
MCILMPITSEICYIYCVFIFITYIMFHFSHQYSKFKTYVLYSIVLLFLRLAGTFGEVILVLL